jgi:23S rRNA (cytidine1920-2'-O)/16S rRNA (cytidine1409-2'-O)-methyltransferase
VKALIFKKHMQSEKKFVSRGGYKLDFALEEFKIAADGLVCADFGASTGGFVDCWLQRGANKVYAVETGYGVLDWKLRNDPRVVVLERQNALHVNLPEKVSLISIDCSWTRQSKILPNALANLRDDGLIISLIKPHYEADKKLLYRGKLPINEIPDVLEKVRNFLLQVGVEILQEIPSPITGEKGGNSEFLFLLRKI